MLTPVMPDVAANGRYSVTQTATLLGIHRNTLRRYTDQGAIKAAKRRTGRGDRFYLGREILRFWKVFW